MPIYPKIFAIGLLVSCHSIELRAEDLKPIQAANKQSSQALAPVNVTRSHEVNGPFGSFTIPGARVVHTVVISVRGPETVHDLRISNPLPAGTTYVTGSLALNGEQLSDAADDDAGMVDTKDIELALDSAPGGSVNTFTFQVTVDG
ncbi:hypothetical protein [Erythrobacter litoralis]|uniref:hypothetical protein n=1 Tax=Erythrobacter litoralis TaxID=39960 RepID=UPI0024350B6C|nr:hypothetical protein [Erythrobacter litoralis]